MERRPTKALKNVNHVLCSGRLVFHYDSNKPLTLAGDASLYRLGAVLSHVLADWTEKPIAYIFRTLTSAEIIPKLKKKTWLLCTQHKCFTFHLFLCNRNFMVIIEHKPFLGILSEEKRTPNFSFFTHTNMGGNFSRV